MKPPFEQFIEENLGKFEDHFKSEGMTANTRTDRMKGAREFAVFLLGRPHRKGEVAKGKI
jgi:hypothetical protein